MPTVETNGIQTYYERHGAGYPIVFSHGGTWDHRSWAPQVEYFADDYDVITYDIRGHGKTSHDGSDPSMSLLADDLKALVDALDLDQPVIVGLSLGGVIAHTYAANYPNSLAAVVPVEARVSGDMTRGQQGLFTLMNPVIRVFGIETIFTLTKWRTRLFGDEEALDEEVPGLEQPHLDYLHDAASKINPEDFLAIMTELMDYEAGDLSAISVPTLVVTGEDPPEVITKGRRRMEQEIPDVRSTAINDAGHGVNLENPDDFNDTVGRFVEQVVENDVVAAE